jgi:cytochrome d ubiquinol oxidase subunit I
MQTPAGYKIVEGVFEPDSWWAIVFNPSFPYRLAHMVLAAFITTCFVIGGVSAGYLRRGVHVEAARRMLKAAVIFAAITVPAQVLVGDQHGLNALEHQPIKVAAMEGHWEHYPKGEGVPLVLFGLPNQKAERNDMEIAVPRLGSVILTHSWDGEIPPLKSVPASERPPVAPVFWGFRVMVGLGTLMLLLTLTSLWLFWRKRLYESRFVLHGWRAMMLSGFVCILAGWYVAEIGRQPYVIYGLLRTADAVSPILAAASVLTSLIVYMVVYAIVFGAGIWYLSRLVKKGPLPHEPPQHTEGGEKTPARPLSAAGENLEEGV